MKRNIQKNGFPLLVFLTVSCLFPINAASNSITQKSKQIPTKFNGMFELYKNNRNLEIGNYITSDFILTAYSLLCRDVLSDVEEKMLYPAFNTLVDRLLEKIQQDLETETSQKETLISVHTYLSVLKKLLDPLYQPPDAVKELVRNEITLIKAHQGIELSPLFQVKEDYSQYLPRGKYTASEKKKNYFMAMTYAGRMGFYLRESQATGVTSDLAGKHTNQALYLSRKIQEEELLSLYMRINQLLDFFIGESLDLGATDYYRWGKNLGFEAARKKILKNAKAEKKFPRVLSTIIQTNLLEPGLKAEEAALGFKLFGQRYTPDSFLFQSLVYDKVTNYKGKGNPFTMTIAAGAKVRGFPRALDLLALLGSHKALEFLKNSDDSNYEGYENQLNKMKQVLSKEMSNPVSLYASNLQLIKDMANEECNTGQKINRSLGSWTQQRHNFILYVKQGYTMVSKGMALDKKRDFALVEDSVVYEGLRNNIKTILGVFNDKALENKLSRFDKVLENLLSILTRQKEAKVTPADYDFLNDLDLTFKSFLKEEDLPIVVDVHTDANSAKVLEEAVGYPDAEMKIAANHLVRGARYTFYEFKQPLKERLTDEGWREMLNKGNVPASSFEAFEKNDKNKKEVNK
jgi:hypothetical protein